jgi:predicted AAA+ superfamily ATPase
LVLYSDLAHETLLADIAGIYRDWEAQPAPGASETVRCELRGRLASAAKHLLDLATTYGFDCDLWRDYLAFCLLSCENSFSLTAERRGMAAQASVSAIARADLVVFLELAQWDFSALEDALDLRVFSLLRSYKAVDKSRRNYYAAISAQVRALSDAMARAADADALFGLVVDAYRTTGVGLFGLGGAFRIRRSEDSPTRDAYTPDAYATGTLQFVPINNIDDLGLDDLVGYESQKQQLIANTDAFVGGRPANNVLLYGDAGTGKSTCVKALVNRYHDRGLRMIEIYKHQFRDLSRVIEAVKHRNYRFVIFIDDLSFEENEVEYKFLKAVIEGGVEARPDNVLIYATSNRRHLIRETWSDRNDMTHDDDVHRSDTVEEKLSLAERFGVTIGFSSPVPKLYHEMVLELAHRQLTEAFDEQALLLLADRWGIRHGGVSGRVAQQFVDHLAGGPLPPELAPTFPED